MGSTARWFSPAFRYSTVNGPEGSPSATPSAPHSKLAWIRVTSTPGRRTERSSARADAPVPAISTTPAIMAISRMCNLPRALCYAEIIRLATNNGDPAPAPILHRHPTTLILLDGWHLPLPLRSIGKFLRSRLQQPKILLCKIRVGASTGIIDYAMLVAIVSEA